MTLIIGLTGSIASGKSTVSRMFGTLGIPVVDADKIARDVVEPGEPALKEIADTFGNEVLLVDGTLDRKKLGAIVFEDAASRNQLNRIMHPAIRTRMLRERDEHAASGVPAVVLDIPLLFESGLSHFVDKTIVVAVDEAVQLERLMMRDESTEQDARKRISSQMPIKEKARQADAVIDNNGTENEAFLQLKNLLAKWNVL